MSYFVQKTLLISGLFVLLAGCAQKQEVEESAEEAAAQAAFKKKVLRWKGTAGSDFFLVKLDQIPTESVRNALKEQGVERLEPLFNLSFGDVELKKSVGLDRWFMAYPGDAALLDQVVLAVAASSHVTSIEYNVAPEITEEVQVIPVKDVPLTKAASSVAKFNDPLLDDQWHYINNGLMSIASTSVKGADVNVKDVWNRITCGDPSIIVAVADYGVKYNHQDLKDNMWVNPGEKPDNGIDDDGNGYVDDVYGYNFVAKSAELTWKSGHGTHCAGTIAAVNNNNRGVAGVAGGSGKKDGCRIMSCQVLCSKEEPWSGSGSPYTTAKAAEYAADMGASVLSCSIGYQYAFTSDNDYLQRQGSAEIDALHYFEKKANNSAVNGGICIFAAGNESEAYAHYPGAFYDIISVSAFGPDYMPAPYTNYGPGCNITAPGGNLALSSKAGVLSTVPSEVYQSDWAYMNGTSMACPHVSGVVALGLSYAVQLGKTIPHDEFKRMILASTDDIDQRITKSTDVKMAKYYHQMGAGAIDAWRLMMKIEGTPTSTAQLGVQQWIDLTSTFGTASVSLTYLNVDIPQETIDALGLKKITGTSQEKYPCVPEGECYGYVQFGRLYIHPTKIGSGKFSITVVGGGDHLGGGDNPPGGMELEQDLSIIVRDVNGGNGIGGWL